MAELADAFIAFPGGIGTFEEFFEAFTWARLGIHAKPCGVLNVEGYYDPLLDLLDHAEHRTLADRAVATFKDVVIGDALDRCLEEGELIADERVGPDEMSLVGVVAIGLCTIDEVK